MKNKKKILAAMVVLLAAHPAGATEGGSTNKIPGVDTVLVGVMGPPGSLRAANFLGYYHATKTVDGAGNARPGISNFDLEVWALTTRLQYVWPDARFLGGEIESRLGLPLYAHAQVRLDVQTPTGSIHRSGSSKAAFPGALVAPVLLGWRGDTVHQMAGPELFLSANRWFTSGATINASTGFHSAAPAYWVTWFPSREIEIDGAFVYLFNGKNDKTNYRSGQELNVDYAASYAVTPAWQVGASGYVYKQMTDDKQNGTVVPGGNRGQAFGIGPFVRYHPSPDFGMTFKWQNEAWVENRAKGNRFFLQLALRLR